MTTAKTVTNPNDALNRVLAKTCRTLGAREITLRYLSQPTGVRWIATALPHHHSVTAKLGIDLAGGDRSFSLDDPAHYADTPIARGEGPTALDAMGAMTPVTWKAPT